jgi:hypothetical protein
VEGANQPRGYNRAADAYVGSKRRTESSYTQRGLLGLGSVEDGLESGCCPCRRAGSESDVRGGGSQGGQGCCSVPSYRRESLTFSALYDVERFDSLAPTQLIMAEKQLAKRTHRPRRPPCQSPTYTSSLPPYALLPERAHHHLASNLLEATR